MICQICNEELKSKKALAIHINNKHIETTKEEYYINYISINNEHICPVCGKDNKFQSFSKGFYKTCSKRCGQKNIATLNKRKENCLKKYGVEHHSQTDGYKSKFKQTCLEKYGVENPFQSEEIKEKMKETWISNYGVDNPSKSKEILEKIENTFLEKYGEITPLMNKEVKLKIKETLMSRYGVEHNSQTKEYKESYKKTSILRYGTEHPKQSDQIKEKCKKNNLEKYGVEYSQQSDVVKMKVKKKFYMTLFNSDRLQGKVTPKFELKDFKGTKIKYPFECNVCQDIFLGYMKDGRIPRCLNCYPYQTGTSKQEQKIYEYVKSLLPENTIILQNDRTILNPYELDIYVPEYNFAIEFNGLYWHSEENRKNKYYHFNKTKQCIDKNIQLFQIFEDEWEFKSNIVKSLIKTQLNLNHIHNTNENEYKIKFIDDIEILYDFYLNNRLHGIPNEFEEGSLNFIGILCKNEIIALIAYLEIEKNSIEIIDYTEKINTNIYNGFNKLKEYLFEQYDFIYYIKDLNNYDMNLFNENKFKYLKPKYYLKENLIWDCGWSHINLKEVV